MITVISPLTWGIYTTPPPDIPECGFVGELCPPPVQGILNYSTLFTQTGVYVLYSGSKGCIQVFAINNGKMALLNLRCEITHTL